MKVALDAMGGDHAPAVNIGGAKEALRLYPTIEKIFLVGDQAALEAECARLLPLGATRVQLLLADDQNESCLVMQDVEGNEFCLD